MTIVRTAAIAIRSSELTVTAIITIIHTVFLLIVLPSADTTVDVSRVWVDVATGCVKDVMSELVVDVATGCRVDVLWVTEVVTTVGEAVDLVGRNEFVLCDVTSKADVVLSVGTVAPVVVLNVGVVLTDHIVVLYGIIVVTYGGVVSL